MNDNSLKVIEIDVNDILPNRFQPRIQFDENEILELSDSIKEHGVIQPLVVRPIGNKYEIIAGERRYKASVLAGKETVPAIVKNLNDRDSAEIALIENVQRKNLTPIEEAISYKKILDMGYLNQTTLADKIGKSQSSVANKIRLLNLSDEVQEALLENKISERHARSLLKITSTKQQNEMLERIISERLTVRRTDEEIQKLLNGENEDADDGGDNKIIEKGESDNMNYENTNDNFELNIPSYQAEEEKPIEIPVVSPVEVSTVEENKFIPNIPMENIPHEIKIPFNENNSMPSMPELPSMSAIPNPIEFNNEPTSVSESKPSTELEEKPTPKVIIVKDNKEDKNIKSTPEIPVTSPIIDETNEIKFPNLEIPSFDISSSDKNKDDSIVPSISFDDILSDNSSANAPKEQADLKEQNRPIIITDYSKQYDPVMPNKKEEKVVPKASLKEVISIIRNCSKQIEQMGYKLELEEYDLQDIYQVAFKIFKDN